MRPCLKKRIDSFRHAFRGIGTLFRQTPNARIHLTMAISAILLGFSFSISAAEWMAVSIVIGMVFGLEAINTAIEILADFVCKGQNDSIRKAKDLAAAGVLSVSITALIVGIVIFLPRVIALLR